MYIYNILSVCFGGRCAFLLFLMYSSGGEKRARCMALGTRWRLDISHHCSSFAADRTALLYKARADRLAASAATPRDDAGDYMTNRTSPAVPGPHQARARSSQRAIASVRTVLAVYAKNARSLLETNGAQSKRDRDHFNIQGKQASRRNTRSERLAKGEIEKGEK